MVDLLQDPSLGHIHDGAIGAKLPFSSVINNAAVLNGPIQTFNPSINSSSEGVIFDNLSNPGTELFGSASVHTGPARFQENGAVANGAVWINTSFPGIIIGASSTTLLFPQLLSIYETDLNKLFSLFFFDAANLLGLGSTTVVIGDNGSSLSGNAGTGNLKFLSDGASRNADLSTFSSVTAKVTGTVNLVNADETQASATVPNADTTLKTYTLAANTYATIIVEAEGYGQFGATSTNQTVNIKVKFAGTQKGQTMALDAALAASAKVPFPIKASGAFTAGGTVTVTIGAAAADANTTIFLNSLRVYGVY